MTPRAIEVLRAADVVYAEDTRITRRLFTRFEIGGELRRFDAATAARKTDEVLARLRSGDEVALVSDAGTPGISDPGAALVAAAHTAGIPVSTTPGASAAIAALSVSGLPTQSFYFGGFLPRKAGKQERIISAVADLETTLIFYESPYRVAKTFETLDVLLPGRSGAFVRELTKRFEEIRQGTLTELAQVLKTRAETGRNKGEFVILVAPKDWSVQAAEQPGK
jgi:16S rRNA (cytidine1402-2'-O)-methyltransferase